MSRFNIFCILLVVRGPMISNSAGTRDSQFTSVQYLSLGLKGVMLSPSLLGLSPLLNAYGTQMWGVLNLPPPILHC